MVMALFSLLGNPLACLQPRSYLNLVPESHLQRRVTRLRAPPPNRLSALQGGSRFKKPTSNTHPLHLARCSRFFLAGSFLPGPYGEDRLRGAAFRSVGDCSSERRFRADFEPFIDLLSSRKIPLGCALMTRSRVTLAHWKMASR
jgi:hypothetical protein